MDGTQQRDEGEVRAAAAPAPIGDRSQAGLSYSTREVRRRFRPLVLVVLAAVAVLAIAAVVLQVH